MVLIPKPRLVELLPSPVGRRKWFIPPIPATGSQIHAEINGAVNELDKVTQQNAAVIEETSAASNALSQEAERLTDALAHIRSGEILETDTTEDTDDTVHVFFRSQAGGGQTETVSLATAANGDDQDGWQDF